jgi:branched-chain amino acid transport system substrate-binding protein
MPAAAEIVIGIAGPFTGKDAALGDQLRRGVEYAAADINKSGGLKGQPLKTLELDDACEPKQAVSVANQFVGENVPVVFGHVCSAASMAASDVYAEANIVEISASSTNPKFTGRGLTNVFRTIGRDDQQAPVGAEYLLRHAPDGRIAVVHEKTAYGTGLADEFLKALDKARHPAVLDEAITPGEKDYSTLVSKLKLARADYLYYGGFYTEAGLIVRQMRDQGLKTILFGADAINTQQYWSITGEAGEGTLMTFTADHRMDPGNRDIIARYRAENFEPEGITLYAYAAVQAWAQAVASAGELANDKVIAALRANKFDTVIGKIGFDGRGDNTAASFTVYRWHDGNFTESP